MADTEEELFIFEEEFTDNDFINLILSPETSDNMSQDEIIKKLLEHINDCYEYEKSLNLELEEKNRKIKHLEIVLEKYNTDSIMKDSNEALEEREPLLFSRYLREGYKVRMPVGLIVAEDKEGNTKVIAHTDGGDWVNNPPPTTVHEVIDRTPTHLIVSVTEEQKDGSYIEIDRYKITA